LPISSIAPVAAEALNAGRSKAVQKAAMLGQPEGGSSLQLLIPRLLLPLPLLPSPPRRPSAAGDSPAAAAKKTAGGRAAAAASAAGGAARLPSQPAASADASAGSSAATSATAAAARRPTPSSPGGAAASALAAALTGSHCGKPGCGEPGTRAEAARASACSASTAAATLSSLRHRTQLKLQARNAQRGGSGTHARLRACIGNLQTKQKPLKYAPGEHSVRRRGFGACRSE
jgi:hypothetical protein